MRYGNLRFRLGHAEAKLAPVRVGTLDGDEIEELQPLLDGDTAALVRARAEARLAPGGRRRERPAATQWRDPGI